VGDSGSWCLLAAALCVPASLFLSVVNYALDSISWVKLEEGFTAAGMAQRTEIVRRDLARFVSSSAVLRLLANLGLLLFVVQYFLIRNAAGSSGLFWLLLKAFVIAGVLLIAFSVVIPRAWAEHAGTPVLVHCFVLIRFLERLSWPLTTVSELIDSPVRRLAGVSDYKDLMEEKQDELLNVVEEGEKEGVVDEEEKDMIASILEFRDTTAEEIMTPRTDIVGIKVNLKFPEVVDIVIKGGHSRYPVYEDSMDNIIGVLYIKDMLREVNHPNDSVDLSSLLRKCYFVPASKCLRDLLHDFQEQLVHMAIVLDEYGGTAGVVTIEDILEELVGEITDEHDPPRGEPIKKVNANTIDVDARCEVDELNDAFDNLNIPEDDDYETVGGFVFAKLGYIPKIGETFEHGNLSFTVVDAQQRKINRLRIVILPAPDESHNGKK
jgi:putative hemolysin